MEAATSVGIEEVIKGLKGLILNRIRYLAQYQSNMSGFQSQFEELKAKVDGLHAQAGAVQRNLQEPSKDVQLWLCSSEVIMADCDYVEEEIKKKESRCLWGMCSNWWSRYKVSKKTFEMEEKIKKHLEKGTNITVSYTPPPPIVEQRSTSYVEGLDSMETAKKKVMDALKDPNINVIGVQGMGGVGKTTLMERVNNDLVNVSGLFKNVIMVTVSDQPDIKKLQDAIAKRLGLQLDDGSELPVRANRLLKRLREEGSVLIILDDLWDRLEMNQVGIPSGNEGQRCCKVVLTTRKMDVCRRMGVGHAIQMVGLTDEESWELFRKKTGEVVDRPSIKPHAVEVCRECAGLPLAITVVGSSLRNEEDEYTWKRTKSYFSGNAGWTEMENDKVRKVLKYSYDRLHKEDLKKCFLLCSLFPEDHVIHARDLMLYGMGEGFLKSIEISPWETSCVLVHKLKSSSLLLDVNRSFNDDESIFDIARRKSTTRMHDLLRDLAISIASRDNGCKFFVSGRKGLKAWPENERLEGCKWISLMENDISSLPDNPGCKEAQALLLQGNENLMAIPDDFFTYTPDLLILDLRKTRLTSFPPSVQTLEKLRVLAFSRSKKSMDFVPDMRHVLVMKNLVVLVLNGVRIQELAEGFGELVQLRVLDLNWCIIDAIRPNVISKLTRLEELRILPPDGEGRNIALFSELASLPHLSTLQVLVEDEEIFSQEIAASDIPSGTTFPSLTSFFLANTWKRRMPLFRNLGDAYDLLIPTLCIRSRAPLACWVKVLLEKTHILLFEETHIFSSGLQEVLLVPPIGGSFQSMKIIHIYGCGSLHCIFPLRIVTSSCLLQQLEVLSIEDCDKLEAIFSFGLQEVLLVPPTGGSFQSLKRIDINGCGSLRCIFPSSIVTSSCLLQQLEVLTVNDCIKLEAIFSSGLQEVLLVPPIGGSFQSLKRINISGCGSLRCIFPLSIVTSSCLLQQLEELTIFSCKKLEAIFSSGLQEVLLVPPIGGSFQSLKRININGCGSLRCIFPLSIVTSSCLLQQLEELTVVDCNVLEGIIGMEDEEKVEAVGNSSSSSDNKDDHQEIQLPTTIGEGGGGVNHSRCRRQVKLPLFPKLRSLELRDLPLMETTVYYQRSDSNGRSIASSFSRGLLLDWPSLVEICVVRCPKLKRMFVGIQSAPNLKEIFGKEEWFNQLIWEDDINAPQRFRDLLEQIKTR